MFFRFTFIHNRAPDCAQGVLIMAVYTFNARQDLSVNRRWVYASLLKAQQDRDKLLAAGGSPGHIWACEKDPQRALECCWLRDGYTVRQVLKRINRVLKREGLLENTEGFGASSMDREFWEARWDSFPGGRAV